MSQPVVTAARLDVLTSVLSHEEIASKNANLGSAVKSMYEGRTPRIEVCTTYRREIARVYDWLDRETTPAYA
jgi:hypothetical protein